MISVIVAIYNVESYLQKCLDSLSAQDFEDVEFLLIDDGSTDNSGEIADHYQDSRFRVFHTSNHGLSAARNYGLDKARGNWIMFVDGDDWVAPDFCCAPYKAAMEQNADIVVFQSYYQKNGKISEYQAKSIIPQGIVSEETAITLGRFAAWNKLYKRCLFDTIRYPEGRVYEDIYTTHRLIHLSERTVFIPNRLYFQVYRKSSISHVASAQNKKDWFSACLQRNHDLDSYGVENKSKERQLCESAIAYLMSSYPVNDPAYIKAEQIVESVKKWPAGMKWKKKVMVNLWRSNKPIFHGLCLLLGVRDRKTRTVVEKV